MGDRLKFFVLTVGCMMALVGVSMTLAFAFVNLNAAASSTSSFLGSAPEPSERGKRCLSPADVRELLKGEDVPGWFVTVFVPGSLEADRVSLDDLGARNLHVERRFYLRWAAIDDLMFKDVVCGGEVWFHDCSIGSYGATLERVSARFVRLESTGIEGSLMVRDVNNFELVECGIHTDLRLENIGGAELSLAGTAVGRNVKISGLEVRGLDLRGFTCTGDFDLDPGDMLEVIHCDPEDAARISHALPRSSRVRLVYAGMGR